MICDAGENVKKKLSLSNNKPSQGNFMSIALS